MPRAAQTNIPEVRHKPKFSKMTVEAKKVLDAAGAISEQYVKACYAARQAVVYEASPMLHKAVFSEIVGLNGRGYSLLHTIMDREAYVSLETLNSLYEAAIACDCCQDKNDMQRSAAPRCERAEKRAPATGHQSLEERTALLQQFPGNSLHQRGAPHEQALKETMNNRRGATGQREPLA